MDFKTNILAKAKNTENDLRFLLCELLKEKGICCPDWHFSTTAVLKAKTPTMEMETVLKFISVLKLDGDIIRHGQAENEFLKLVLLKDETSRAKQEMERIYATKISKKNDRPRTPRKRGRKKIWQDGRRTGNGGSACEAKARN